VNLTIAIEPSASVTSGTSTNVTGFGCISYNSLLECILYRDNVNVTNPEISSLGIGTYYYAYNTTGNENYSSANATAILSVTSPGPGPGPGPCSDRIWTCGNWTNCSSEGEQERECISNCDRTRTETQECECNSHWNCTEWGRCINGTKYRTCEDLRHCRVVKNQPELETHCEMKPEECKPHYECLNWSECNYQDKVGDILKGEISLTGYKERLCVDTHECKENITEYMNCTSGIELEFVKEIVCKENILIALNKKTRVPIMAVNLDSWEANLLDVSYIQSNATYCPTCYDEVKDGNEQGIDCGGDCRPCEPESRFPISLMTWLLWALAVILLILLLKRSRDDDDLIAAIRALIKNGEMALRKEDRKRAMDNFRKIKWLYVQIENKDKKKKILKEMQKYYRKIKKFYEF
jgi:hypothetical protein